MVKTIKIDKVDNGFIVTRIVQEGERTTLTDLKVFADAEKEKMVEWVKANA